MTDLSGEDVRISLYALPSSGVITMYAQRQRAGTRLQVLVSGGLIIDSYRDLVGVVPCTSPALPKR